MHSYTKGSPTAWQRKCSCIGRTTTGPPSITANFLFLSEQTFFFNTQRRSEGKRKGKTHQTTWLKQAKHTEQQQAYIIHHLSHLQTLSHNKHNTGRTPNTPNNNIYSPPLFNRHMNFRFHISFPLAPTFKRIKAKTSFAFLVVLAKQHSWAWKTQITCHTETDSLHHLATGTNTGTFLTVSIQTLIAKDISMEESTLEMRLSVFKQGTFQGLFLWA